MGVLRSAIKVQDYEEVNEAGAVVAMMIKGDAQVGVFDYSEVTSLFSAIILVLQVRSSCLQRVPENIQFFRAR